MLGHMGLFGCGSTKCPHCSEDDTTRRRKRIEQRDVARELEDEAWFIPPLGGVSERAREVWQQAAREGR
jgi:hypothetical protein